MSFLFLPLFLAIAPGVEGHGRLTMPVARNGGDNGAVGGGPGTVYSGGVESNYKHGICGNAPGQPQKFNEVGPIKAVYKEGHAASIELQITAHHIGFFDFDLCVDAGKLSEECFAQHHLLRDGCDCDCPGDASNSCEACIECRRWWKPLVQGEVGYWPARGYVEQGSVVLPGDGNLRVYNFVVSYVIPTGTASKNAVLRWHYMTTNSCTSGASAPEEFWNCADITIVDGSNPPPEIDYSNDELRELPVNNLIPLITAGKLPGLQSGCPVDGLGQLQGIGNADAYMFCGDEVPISSRSAGNLGPYENCNSPQHSQAENCGLNSAGIKCDKEDFYFQCIDGNTVLQPVPVGQCCKNNAFVPESECNGPTPPPTPRPPSPPIGDCKKFGSPAIAGNVNGCTDSYCQDCSEGYTYWPCNLEVPCCTCIDSVETTAKPEPSNTTAAEPGPTTAAPTTTTAATDCPNWCTTNPKPIEAKCNQYTDCKSCDFCEDAPKPSTDCYDWCESNVEADDTKCTWEHCEGCSFCPGPEPEPETTTPSPPPPSSCKDLNGKSCDGCLASNNVCYQQPESWCDLYPTYKWCGNDAAVYCSHWPYYRSCGSTITDLWSGGNVSGPGGSANMGAVMTVGAVLVALGSFAVGFRWYHRRGENQATQLENDITTELEAANAE